MKIKTVILALVAITVALGLFITPTMAQVDSAKICQGKDAKFNPRYGYKVGCTPLHNAADKNACKSAARLIANGANIHARAKTGGYCAPGVTPLGMAVRRDAFETAKLLIAHGADVNMSRGYGAGNLLHFAASSNAVKTAELLIANGVDIHARLQTTGVTALHLAVDAEAVEVAKLLIASGAKVNARTNRGKTPLDYAKDFELKAMINILRAHGGK